MEQPEIRIYIGKIRQWTTDIENQKQKESVCGRRLLAYGLFEHCRREFPDAFSGADELYEHLDEMIEKGEHGKPFLKEFPQICFNISHSGEYGACALSSVPCGLDIQEVKPIRNKRIVERVLSKEEQQMVQMAEDSQRAFFQYWTRKESFLKLTGEGITRSMREVKESEWFEEFLIGNNVLGCIAASCKCSVSLLQIPADMF